MRGNESHPEGVPDPCGEIACDETHDASGMPTQGLAPPSGLRVSNEMIWSRRSESAETTGVVVNHDRTPKGCQTPQ